MIYLHVPFCRSFCTYCDFYSEIACKGRDEAAMARWADEVCAEAEARRQEIGSTLDLDTLYIGGGTPSVLPLSVLRQVIDRLASLRDGQRAGLAPKKRAASTGIARPMGPGYEEFTVEVNPEDIVEKGADYVRGLLDLGVTRISMGVQSLDDGILRWMNRRHSADGARKAYGIIRSVAGGQNRPVAVSVDLISGVPGMTEEILSSSLEEIISWRPEHISAYQLSIEEGSALARMIEEEKVLELGEDECRAQYDLLCARLAEAGYHHYEISNWALPGHEAVHNSAYWTRHPYVGLGPGAHSLIFYDAEGRPSGRAMPVQSAPGGSLTGPLPGADGKQRRSWNSQALSGWTSDGEELTSEQIHEEEVMLLARTDRGPIPEKDWFIADEIITDLL
ncbi:MAG: coproporphyrinogen III oxidase family protein [Bacteroidales bacterium]|nr:coproporphyrinogen III oxidase family protein [Bacteroidales bacterium]